MHFQNMKHRYVSCFSLCFNYAVRFIYFTIQLTVHIHDSCTSVHEHSFFNSFILFQFTFPTCTYMHLVMYFVFSYYQLLYCHSVMQFNFLFKDHIYRHLNQPILHAVDGGRLGEK